MIKIQRKCVQTILNNDGKLLEYRITLPVPRGYLNPIDMNPFVLKRYNMLTTKKGKCTWYFNYVDKDWDKLNEVLNIEQMKITTWKVQQLQSKMVYHANNAITYKLKQED